MKKMTLNDTVFQEIISEIDDNLGYAIHNLYDPYDIEMTKAELKELISCVEDTYKLIKPLKKLLRCKPGLKNGNRI